MISKERALEIIQESLASLRRSGVISADIVVTAGTVLLGAGSQLDSIGFVTFVTETEDRISRETGMELYLILADIHDFNTEDANLSAETLAQYISQLTQA